LEREELWDINNVVKKINLFPQTYSTILDNLVNEGSCQVILRRKLNNLVKEGIIFKATIPGTRWGKSIMYVRDKKYFILVESGRMGTNVFCFFDYEKKGRFWIIVKKCWKLDGCQWRLLSNQKNFFEGKILLFI
jgi:hypothetical protein